VEDDEELRLQVVLEAVALEDLLELGEL